MVTNRSRIPFFAVGEVVVHRIYHYRAVVAALDPTCQADEEWYQSNQTQPSKDQAWYHLLVDGAQHVTYSAESNLQRDGSGAPIVHPMLNLFFFGLNEETNQYLRNEVPWNPENLRMRPFFTSGLHSPTTPPNLAGALKKKAVAYVFAKRQVRFLDQ